MPTIMFSSSSYRVLFQSFFPQNISLLPKIVTEARANFKKKKTSCNTTLKHSAVLVKLWPKVFPLWNEFKAQRELGACLMIKLGKTRLKWQLTCREVPSLLRGTGIKPLTGTAVYKTVLNFGSNSVYSSADQNNSARTRWKNRQSVKTNLLIYDFYNH